MYSSEQLGKETYPGILSWKFYSAHLVDTVDPLFNHLFSMFTLLGTNILIKAKHLDSIFELVCLNWEIRTIGLGHLAMRRIDLVLLSFRCFSDYLVRRIWQVT